MQIRVFHVMNSEKEARMASFIADLGEVEIVSCTPVATTDTGVTYVLVHK